MEQNIFTKKKMLYNIFDFDENAGSINKINDHFVQVTVYF